MATFASTILPALDAVRTIGGRLGLRPVQVKVRRRVWTGGPPGSPGATKVDTDTVLVNAGPDGTTWPVRIRQLSRREVLSSGGLYRDGDLKVLDVTPTYLASVIGPAGGFDDTTIDPTPTAGPTSSTEIFWILSSASGTFGLPASGLVFEKKGEENGALHTHVVLRSKGVAPT